MILFSFLSKRPGATVAGVFSLALSSVLLLCGAGLTPTGTVMQADIDANGYNLTNAATVSAANVIVSGSLTAPALGSLAGLSPTGTADSSHYLRGDDTWATVPTGYTLPNATTTTLGGVIVGSGLSVSGGTIAASYGTTSGTALQGNSIGVTVQAYSANLNTLAATTFDSTVLGAVNNAVNTSNGFLQLDSLGNADLTSGLNLATGGLLVVGSGGYIASDTYYNTSQTSQFATYSGGAWTLPGIFTSGLDNSVVTAVAVPVNAHDGLALYGFVSPPATSSDSGAAGQFSYDGTYYYFYDVANTKWRRIAWDATF